MTEEGDRPEGGSEPALLAGEPGSPMAPPPAPGAAPSPATPLVAWEAPVAAAPVATAGEAGYDGAPPPFTVGALLSDTFARYGADLVRLLAVSVVVSALSWLTSFAAPMSANPFAQPRGFVDVSGILGLLSFVAGIVGTSTMLALAEGGPGVSFGRAIRRGAERSGWLFLTSLVMGAAFIALFLVALIPIALFAIISPILIVVPMLALFAVFVWAGLRLLLALPAVVADNRNTIEGLKLSWQVTKPTGVWARLLGATLLLGLLVAPAAIGALLLVIPAMVSSMFAGAGPQSLLLLLVPAIAFSVLTPLSLLISFSAYRRLVPPSQPSWTASQSAPAAPASPAAPAAPETPAAPAAPSSTPPPVPPDPATTATEAALAATTEPAAADLRVDTEPATTAPALAPEPPPPLLAPESPPPPLRPAFNVPRLGTAAKGLLALVLAFDVAGVVAIPYAVVEFERLARDGFPGFPGGPGAPGFPGPQGFVFPGQVAFGRNADLDTCSIEGRLFFATAGTQIEFLAALEQTTTPQDEVFLRITRDGQVLETTLQDPGAYDCLGSVTPEPALVDGVYTYEVIVNGQVSATGSLIVG